MKILKLFALAFLFLNLMPGGVAEAFCNINVVPNWDSSWCTLPSHSWGYYFDRGIHYYPEPDYVTATCPYVNAGYTCSKYYAGSCGFGYSSPNGYKCTKDNYSAAQSGTYTLVGNKTTNTVTTYTIMASWEKPSPFIYLRNAPEGPISVSLDSALDDFSPLPAFTNTAAWQGEVKGGQLFVDGHKTDHLFYELALNKLTLSRYGRNFTSKESLIHYLETSDFFTQMDYNAEETKNSRDYIITHLQAEPELPNYYLTVLDKEATEEVSTLNINPAPKTITRNFYAIYPGIVPVKVAGYIRFPEKREATTEFNVMETGELLVNPSMFIFFK